MIYLGTGSEASPSGLFDLETCPAFARRLLTKAAEYQELASLGDAERFAREAQRASDKAQAHVAHVMALVRLSDIYRKMGKTGPALHCAEEACEHIKRQPGLQQRYEEAVTTYNLGLIHLLLGNVTDALIQYDKAMDYIEQAEKFWSSTGNDETTERCRSLKEWIEDLRRSLIELPDDCEISTTLVIPARFAVGDRLELPISESCLIRQVVIGDRFFHVHALPDGDAVALSRGTYQLVQSRDDHPLMNIAAGDYLLMRRPDGNLRTPCFYVHQNATILEFGYFELDPANARAFSFLAVDTHIIGGQVDAHNLSYLIAVLKPV